VEISSPEMGIFTQDREVFKRDLETFSKLPRAGFFKGVLPLTKE
jgi:hypothetical protein